MYVALKDAFERELYNYQKVKFLAYVCLNRRECNVQECVYHIVPGQWPSKTFAGVVFTNSNLPEKTFRICLSERKIYELPEDSTRIF